MRTTVASPGSAVTAKCMERASRNIAFWKMDTPAQLLLHGIKATGHLIREQKKLTQDFREGDLEKKLQGPAVFFDLGPQQRALPCIEEEFRDCFGREVLGERAGSLRLADHQRNRIRPLSKRHGDLLANQWTLVG